MSVFRCSWLLHIACLARVCGPRLGSLTAASAAPPPMRHCLQPPSHSPASGRVQQHLKICYRNQMHSPQHSKPHRLSVIVSTCTADELCTGRMITTGQVHWPRSVCRTSTVARLRVRSSRLTGGKTMACVSRTACSNIRPHDASC